MGPIGNAPRVAVVVPAAGLGSRMGGVRKPAIELGARSILAWALAPFLQRSDVVEVVVAVSPEGAGSLQLPDDPRVTSASGGSSRFDSVARGLAALSTDANIVAVHDAARPFPPPEALARCIEMAAEGSGAVAGVPATDTVKEVDSDGVVVSTPERTSLWYDHTPQVFPRAVLEQAVAACRAAGFEPTDDAGAVEFVGGTVRMVHGSPRNLKVTYPADVVVARALMEEGLV
ncbi:MAG: 2-C-methyl-D-erythritol 4-phosphate cytidylyltransferase [Gemmatimonadetes bacterium]|nr:2-C-methyl-D-erythritol 4-phosphate cytidylyltransferase [Gemmatimonadota bacterium]